MPSPVVTGFLQQHRVHYCTVPHAEAHTAAQTAAAAHVTGFSLAKTVVVKLDGRLAMVVVPATCRIDLEHVRQATGAKRAELAAEEEFCFAFPDCELGAMPPIGALYGMEVYVCQGLASCDRVFFNGGSHRQLVCMPYAEFAELARPREIGIACGRDCCAHPRRKGGG